MTKTELLEKNLSRIKFYEKEIKDLEKHPHKFSPSAIVQFKAKIRLVKRINKDLKTLPE